MNRIRPENRFWTISNVLSLSRIFIILPGVWLLFQDTENARLWAAVWFAVAALTDTLDGVIARAFNQVSDWGKVIDPLADKISVAAVVIGLTMTGDLPVWFVTAVIIRDVIIFSAGILLTSRTKVIPVSTMLGKITVTVLGVTAILATLQLHEFTGYFLILSLFLLIISLADYGRRMWKELYTK